MPKRATEETRDVLPPPHNGSSPVLRGPTKLLSSWYLIREYFNLPDRRVLRKLSPRCPDQKIRNISTWNSGVRPSVTHTISCHHHVHGNRTRWPRNLMSSWYSIFVVEGELRVDGIKLERGTWRFHLLFFSFSYVAVVLLPRRLFVIYTSTRNTSTCIKYS